MRRPHAGRRGGLAFLLAMLATPAALAAQEARPVVIDAATGRPLSGAQVLLVRGRDTLRRTTDEAGRVRLPADTTGDARLIVRRLGFAALDVAADEVRRGGRATLALTPLAVEVDATVITAARREQRLADAVVPVELISRRQIEETGATDVASVLTEQLGIQTDQSLPGSAGVQLQGLGSQRVLVLVDGQPIVGRIGGTLDLSRISAANVERIEVVKGPMSTLYGSDAMGGVVNVITRQPTGGRTDAYVQAISGTQSRQDLTGGVRHDGRRFDAGLDLGLRDQALAAGVSNAAATFAQRIDAAPTASFAISDALTLQAGGFVTGERQRYRTGLLYRFVDRDQVAARVGARYVRGAHQAGVLAYHSRFDHLSRASTRPTPQGSLGDRDRQQLTELELTYNGLTPLGQLDAGLELRRESIVADRVDGMRRAWLLAEPFTQLTFAVGRVAITPGARYTWNEQWGSTVAPRLAVLWRAGDALRVRASAGRGFRAPDFKELFLSFANAQAGYAVQGNPMLRPETSGNVQVGVEWTGERVYLRGSAFENRLHDFIQTVGTGAPGVFTYENVARARTRGVESEAGITHGRWRVEGGWSLLDTRDDATGQSLLARPRHSGRLAGSVGNVFGGRFSAVAVHTGAAPLTRAADGTVTTEQPAFTRVDLRIARPLPANAELSAGVDNLFDRRLGDDWPAFTGRRAYVGLSWQVAGRR